MPILANRPNRKKGRKETSKVKNGMLLFWVLNFQTFWAGETQACLLGRRKESVGRKDPKKAKQHPTESRKCDNAQAQWWVSALLLSGQKYQSRHKMSPWKVGLEKEAEEAYAVHF